MLSTFCNNSAMVIRGTIAEGDGSAEDSGVGSVVGSGGGEVAGGGGTGSDVGGAQLHIANTMSMDPTK